MLTSIVGILFRVLVATSGKSILADQDILFFFLGPAGWICFVVVGGIWLGIVALEQAALIGILRAAGEGKRLGVVGALRFTAAAARPVIHDALLATSAIPVPALVQFGLLCALEMGGLGELVKVLAVEVVAESGSGQLWTDQVGRKQHAEIARRVKS